MTTRHLASFGCALFLPFVASVCAAPSPLPYRAKHEHRVTYAGLPPKSRVLLRRLHAQLFRTLLSAAPSKPLTVSDAITVLAQGSRAGDPDRVGISVLARLPREQTSESGPRVTLPRRRYTVAEGFDRICAVTDSFWTIERFTIVIAPLHDPPPQPVP